MNESGWVGFWISLPPTIAAIVAAILSLRNAARAKTTSDNVATIAVKTDQMEKQGNSRWTEQEKKLNAALLEVTELKGIVAQLLPSAHEKGVAKADERGIKSSG